MMTKGTRIRAGAPNLSENGDLPPERRSATILSYAGNAVIQRIQPVEFDTGVNRVEPL